MVGEGGRLFVSKDVFSSNAMSPLPSASMHMSASVHCMCVCVCNLPQANPSLAKAGKNEKKRKSHLYPNPIAAGRRE